MLLRLDNARPGDQEQLACSDGNVPHVEAVQRIGHDSYSSCRSSMLAAHRASKPGEHERQEREPATALLAIDAPDQLPQARRPLLVAMLFACFGHGLCNVLQDLRIEAAEDLNQRNRIAHGVDALLLLRVLSYGAEDRVLCVHRTVQRVEHSLLMRGLKNVPCCKQRFAALL